ncbi:hypothetical protein LUZ60_006006 [Juncus effusus]|nr:hypothetical protein LUZ60_006006 [Juncus effusus]
MIKRQHTSSSSSSCSSIQLLQERFRKLERMKEMRELQKVGLGLGTEPAVEERPKWFLHPDLIRHNYSSSKSITNNGNFICQASTSSASVDRWFDNSKMNNLKSRSDVEVDTSLHL